MSIFHALILGIVEGVTEFLPISSTAHLIFVSRFFNLSQSDFQKFFEVFIQSGAILAIFFLYFRYVIKSRYLIRQIMFSFLPTAALGFILYKVIKNIFFESYSLIIFSFISVGFLFLLIEYLIKNKKINLKKSIKELSLSEAIIIGLAQSIAVIPGISRAGIVMSTMMVMGYKRDESAVYSFILAVPTILAASALDLLKTDFNTVFNFNSLIFLVIGFVTSFFTAYISVRLLISYLQKNSLVVFGLYRLLLAIILLIT